MTWSRRSSLDIHPNKTEYASEEKYDGISVWLDITVTPKGKMTVERASEVIENIVDARRSVNSVYEYVIHQVKRVIGGLERLKSNTDAVVNVSRRVVFNSVVEFMEALVEASEDWSISTGEESPTVEIKKTLKNGALVTITVHVGGFDEI